MTQEQGSWLILAGVIIMTLVEYLRSKAAERRLPQAIQTTMEMMDRAVSPLELVNDSTGEFKFVNNRVSVRYFREVRKGTVFETIDWHFRQFGGGRWVTHYHDGAPRLWFFRGLRGEEIPSSTEASFLTNELLTKVRQLAS